NPEAPFPPATGWVPLPRVGRPTMLLALVVCLTRVNYSHPSWLYFHVIATYSCITLASFHPRPVSGRHIFAMTLPFLRHIRSLFRPHSKPIKALLDGIP